MKLTVDYGQDPHTQKWFCPQQQAWGLLPHQKITPSLAEKLCFTAAASTSYEQAAAVAARWGVAVDDSLIHQQVQLAGERAETLPFPPPKMDVQRPEQVNEPIPQFDAIVGNFPYVSADLIERSNSGYLDFIRKCLIAGWFENYPELFCYENKKDQESFEKAIVAGKHADCDRTTVQLRTSTYADLYVYLFFHATRFLKIGGRMGIVTSNAWLDVNYGYALQKFFCDRFKIVALLESRGEPWFTEASVNTVLTILERCDNAKQRDDHLVKFVKVKKRLTELAPGDPKIEAKARWRKLEQLTDRIEKAGKSYSKTVPLGVATVEDDDFRMRVCRQS